jgi:flagellar hook assembly protein FlgD
MQGRGRFDFYAESALVAELSVYSVDGRRVRRFSSLETVGGWQSVTWDGRDHFGRPAPSGIYSAVLRAGHSTVRRKFALMK